MEIVVHLPGVSETMYRLKGNEQTGAALSGLSCCIYCVNAENRNDVLSCSSVVEHCAYEVTLASQWSAVQTCPGEFFLCSVAAGTCLLLFPCKRIQLTLCYHPGRRERNDLRDKDTHTQEAQEARPTHTIHTECVTSQNSCQCHLPLTHGCNS